MSDPLGLIGAGGGLNSDLPKVPGLGAAPKHDGPSFAQTLQDQLNTVNELEREAQEAIEDLFLNRRTDVESVMLATQKAETAFHLLLQVRNKVMDAYDELKQIRV